MSSGPLVRRARRTVFAVRDRTSHIHSPFFWRVLYALLRTRVAVRCFAVTCSIAGRLAGASGEQVVERFSHLFRNGWPHHRGTPWVNLDVSRFTARTSRRLRRASARPLRPPRPGSVPLRIGILADFDSTLTFVRPFFEQSPDDVDVLAFDLAGPDRASPYLPTLVAEYHAAERREPEQIAELIEAAALDVLVFDAYRTDTYAILDGVSTPCIVDAGSTVDFCFHDSVAFRLYGLQQADYLPRGDRLFCATSRAWFGPEVVFPAALLFENRLGDDPRRPFREREPLLVFHGKLYKASRPYLECVAALLADDSELQLVVMGRGSDEELARIAAIMRRHGADNRFHYEGEFRLHRNAAGEVDDPTWLRLAEYLRRARLAPDPWPLGGAYSRVEAYTAGAPVVHMGIRTDRESWGRPQHAVTADHPALTIPAATAYTVETYRELAARLLHDEELADAVAGQQAELAARLCDPTRFWRDLLASYDTWLAGQSDGRAGRSRLTRASTRARRNASRRSTNSVSR